MRSPFLFERGNAQAFYDAIAGAAACDLASMSDRSRAVAAGYGWPAVWLAASVSSFL